MVEPKGLDTPAPGGASNVGTEDDVALVLVERLCWTFAFVGLLVALDRSAGLFEDASVLAQRFQHTNCPLLVRIANLGHGPDSSTFLEGCTLTVEVKSSTAPRGVSSSPESSSIGMVALSESLRSSTVWFLKKKSISIDFEPTDTNSSGYFGDQSFKMRV